MSSQSKSPACCLQACLHNVSGVSLCWFDGQLRFSVDHFTVACAAAWPLNESEAGSDLVLKETSLLF